MISKILNVLLVLLIIGLVASYLYKLPKYKKGQIAPEFSSTTIDGTKLNLSDFKGKAVLLDFWGSWCGPCRRENKKMTELFDMIKTKDYQNKIEIISVGVENNRESWHAAIEQDKLIWQNHIFQGELFRSPIVKLYGVREIPTKYLIDAAGQIVLTNPSFEEIEAYLANKL